MRGLSKLIAIASLIVGIVCGYGFFTWPVVDVGWVMKVLCLVSTLAQIVPLFGSRFARKPPALGTWLVWLIASLAILYFTGLVAWMVLERLF